MKAVREGEEVLLTERGKPLARIVPLRVRGKVEVAIGRLEASGFLRADAKTEHMPDWQPRPIPGMAKVRTARTARDSTQWLPHESISLVLMEQFVSIFTHWTQSVVWAYDTAS